VSAQSAALDDPPAITPGASLVQIEQSLERCAFSAPADEAAIHAINAAVGQQLAHWKIHPETAFSISLVSVELLANALRHGYTKRFALRLIRRPGELVVECDDDNLEDWPIVRLDRGPENLAESGNGLRLVAALATIGVRLTDVKTVIARVRL
jgi:anti-sigma regulatory factor (Ser/Thr protein kinase)